MPKLRCLSGAEVIHILEGFGFIIHAQAGSHVKLKRIGPYGQKQILTIPNHREDRGECVAVTDNSYSTDEKIMLCEP